MLAKCNIQFHFVLGCIRLKFYGGVGLNHMIQSRNRYILFPIKKECSIQSNRENNNLLSCLILFSLLIVLWTSVDSDAQERTTLTYSKQENVNFSNGEVMLSGNLFLPTVGDQFPAVVILHGSGPDEGLEYKIYAAKFAKAGIAALVYDKRGSGQSGGDWRKRPFEFLAGDALAAVEFLKSRPEINQNKIGLWGISQGGWTAVYAASRSKNVAFVVSVAGNGVSPTQQEMFHKDEMYKALGYSERARDTALKFWKLTFDWLVLIDSGKFPLPDNLLVSERSAASTNLDYNPLPDWEKVSQPVLLIHGSGDKLSPPHQAITTITDALKKGGNQNYTVRVFPNASHTITTNKTGLEFDWDTNFAPDYFQTTTDWIIKPANFSTGQSVAETLNTDSPDDFQAGGRYGQLSWFGQTYPQILLMVLFPLIYLVSLVVSLFGLSRKSSSKPRQRLLFILGLLCFLNLFLIIGFYIFLAVSVFPQGTMLMQNYSIPWWQKVLPLIGIFSLILTITFLVQIIVKKAERSRFMIAMSIISVIFLFWLFYWNLIGLWF